MEISAVGLFGLLARYNQYLWFKRWGVWEDGVNVVGWKL